LVDVELEDVRILLEVSVRVMGLVGLLLHYNASNLVLEILKHDKILGDNLH